MKRLFRVQAFGAPVDPVGHGPVRPPACPVCGGDDLHALMSRSAVPVFQNMRYDSVARARAAATGMLALVICTRCAFGFNAAFDPGLLAYDAGYENDQSNSAAFTIHLVERAAAILGRLPRHEATVLEIGCGQGAFLKLLLDAGAGRVRHAFGFDPAARSPTEHSPLHIRARFFEAAAEPDIGQVDAAVSRHVIEHVGAPVAFLKTIRQAAFAPGARLYLETPCLEWILRNTAFQDIFYEHCNYFCAQSLKWALESAGFAVEAVEHVFGGQYLWALATACDARNAVPAGRVNCGPIVDLSDAFTKRYQSVVRRVRARLEADPGLALWGGGAKGATFAAILDPDATLINCVIDLNPRKQGGFIAVTAHAIVSPREAVERGVRRVAIMNPNYRTEIADFIRANDLPLRVVDLED